MPRFITSTAKRMMRLQEAGLLGTLLSEATVRYFRSTKAYHDCITLQQTISARINGRESGQLTEA